MLIYHNSKLEIIWNTLFWLICKYFFLPLFDLKDKLRLKTHIIVSLNPFNLQLIIILIIFVFLCEDTIVNDQTIQLSVPIVKHRKYNWFYRYCEFSDLLQQWISFIIDFLRILQHISLSHTDCQLNIANLFDVYNNFVFVLFNREINSEV